MLVVFKSQVIDFLAPGFLQHTAIQASNLMAKFIWLMPLTSMAAVSTAYLHSVNIFALPSFGTCLFNLMIIFGLIFWVHNFEEIEILVYFVLLGGLIRWLMHCVVIPKSSVKYLAQAAGSQSHIVSSAFWKRYIQSIFSGGIFLLYPMIARSFSTFNGEGALSVFTYAYTIIKLPLGICITVVVTVLFPSIAMYISNKNKLYEPQFVRDFLHTGLLISFLFSCVFFVPMSFFSEDIIHMIYGGKILEDSLDEITGVVKVGLCMLPLQALSSFLGAIFHAHLNMRSTLHASILGLLCLGVITQPMNQLFGNMGVMLSIVMAYAVVMFWLFVKLKTLYNIDMFSILMRKECCQSFIFIIIISFSLWCLKYVFDLTWVTALVCFGVSALCGFWVVFFYNDRCRKFIFHANEENPIIDPMVRA